jgi:hypothetical protein
VHSHPVLKEHFLITVKKVIQTYHCFTWPAKTDTLLLSSMLHCMYTNFVTYSEVLRQIFAMDLYKEHTTPLP